MSDKIFALATSRQRSALHFHRISGCGVIDSLLPFVKSKKKIDILKISFPYTKYVCLFDDENNLIDDVIITFYKAPHSYTGEDLIEISCHGNPLISRKLQSFLRALGMRDAKEGEFTQRAFLNGKLDLCQAEAIHELIQAQTNAGLKLSRNQIDGALTSEIYNLKDKFMDALSYLEAHIDFNSDEVGDYEPKQIIQQLNEIYERLSNLQKTYQDGIKLKTGLKLVLCGRPNAGKSTLYNKLLKVDRAIVTEIPGTTRDILSEHLQIENRDFVLIDTAGIRNTRHKIERLGVNKSIQMLKEADIVCVIIDGFKNFKKDLTTIEDSLPYLSNDKTMLFVISKSDLLSDKEIQKKLSYLNSKFPHTMSISVSQDDIASLMKSLVVIYDKIMESNSAFDHNAPVLISARSYDHVQIAMNILNQTILLVEERDLPEKIASNLYCILRTLEEILGNFDLDSIYQKIFSKFCIGK